MHTSLKVVVAKCVCFWLNLIESRSCGVWPWLAWFVLYSLSLSDLWQSSCLGLPRDRTKVWPRGQLGIMGERRLAHINQVKEKIAKSSTHFCNPSTKKAQQRIAVSARPAWATEQEPAPKPKQAFTLSSRAPGLGEASVRPRTLSPAPNLGVVMPARNHCPSLSVGGKGRGRGEGRRKCC